MEEKTAKKEISDIIFDALSQKEPIDKKKDKEIKRKIGDILNQMD